MGIKPEVGGYPVNYVKWTMYEWAPYESSTCKLTVQTACVSHWCLKQLNWVKLGGTGRYKSSHLRGSTE